ncbi:hypothetical protein J6590_067337 [Homalodisca vitripennis]|nr:hypothetical protein J6590_067337 [Homalodisca vitripennis]
MNWCPEPQDRPQDGHRSSAGCTLSSSIAKHDSCPLRRAIRPLVVDVISDRSAGCNVAPDQTIHEESSGGSTVIIPLEGALFRSRRHEVAGQSCELPEYDAIRLATTHWRRLPAFLSPQRKFGGMRRKSSESGLNLILSGRVFRSPHSGLECRALTSRQGGANSAHGHGPGTELAPPGYKGVLNQRMNMVEALN